MFFSFFFLSFLLQPNQHRTSYEFLDKSMTLMTKLSLILSTMAQSKSQSHENEKGNLGNMKIVHGSNHTKN